MMADELKQVDDVRTQLRNLRQQVQAGAVFQSLNTKIGAVLDNLPSNDETPVSLPDDTDGIKDLLKMLNQQIRATTLDKITDDQLMQLLNHLGSPDVDVRDRGIYFFFNDALQQHVLSDSQLRLAVNTLLQDRVLFNHITEPENTAIFGRSFAVMILSLLAYADRVDAHFLDAETTMRLVDQLATYIALENDTRGFVGTSGWAHAYTHIGNLLDELAESQVLTRADKVFLMIEILEKYRRLETPLIFGESRRLAAYLATVVNLNDLYEQAFLQEWRQWRVRLSNTPQPEDEAGWTRLFNRSRLLSAMILREDYPEEVSNAINAEVDFLS
ncbi:DUF2785 domain-containing protein [Furfurilactobacillus milii]|uniref:DUF2785 domain-containing protein n=1 Tax=Furfurilactobacillus milii TaxID=2888272 RepID=A0A6N9I4Z8_9LACO|nr:DUF2785 domain-containing protein [Furfurilactobacillus milii]MYV17948.1 DUF2785 domain-containing protein [Furfurilactobacillus milii]